MTDASGRSRAPINEDEVCICFHLRKASRFITQIYDDRMRPLGYRATQVTLLGVINQYGPLSVQKLAGVMDSDRTTLTRNLKVLERDGLVCMKPGKDRRQRQVSVSDKGIRLIREAYPLWKETQDEIQARAGRERLNHLIRDLSDILERIRRPDAS